MATNAAVAVRYPALIKACVEKGWEILANGLDMDHLHYEGLPLEEEQRLVTTTLDILRKASGQKVRGWLSPAKSESFATPDLVANLVLPDFCRRNHDPHGLPSEKAITFGLAAISKTTLTLAS